MNRLFRRLPAVDVLLAALSENETFRNIPRPLLRDAINAFLDGKRNAVRNGTIRDEKELALAALLPELRDFVRTARYASLRQVINGTGIVAHTNLGRSLLSQKALDAVLMAGKYYTNLELDLRTGLRGSRHSHVEPLLCRIVKTEAALAVNNNAAAVFLVLDTFCRGKEVILSRGELVEIGGSFRIPDIMTKSGALLREVGTTNRTRIEDYAQAITENTAALMKVHPSNYRITGFHEEASVRDVALLGKRRGIPVFVDLGSGNLYDFASHAAAEFACLSQDEPTAQRMAADGPDLIFFSGDKILGGPQAGIIAGRKKYIEALKKNPLARVLRLDKLTLAALEATLELYLEPGMAARHIPTLNMILQPEPLLRQKAEKLAGILESALKNAGAPVTTRIRPGCSRIGGGAFPERDLPTSLVCLEPAAPSFTAEHLRAALLHADTPVLGRIEDNGFLLDPRTIAEEEFPLVAKSLQQAAAMAHASDASEKG